MSVVELLSVDEHSTLTLILTYIDNHDVPVWFVSVVGRQHGEGIAPAHGGHVLLYMQDVDWVIVVWVNIRYNELLDPFSMNDISLFVTSKMLPSFLTCLFGCHHQWLNRDNTVYDFQ